MKVGDGWMSVLSTAYSSSQAKQKQKLLSCLWVVKKIRYNDGFLSDKQITDKHQFTHKNQNLNTNYLSCLCVSKKQRSMETFISYVTQKGRGIRYFVTLGYKAYVVTLQKISSRHLVSFRLQIPNICKYRLPTRKYMVSCWGALQLGGPW